MALVTGQIEIAASPARVREVFFDFAKFPEWAEAHIKSIDVASRKQEGTIQAGDTLKVVLKGMTFSPAVLENNEQEFKWRGALPLGIFSGDHSFRFEPSKTNPGGTTFTDSERFTGPLAYLFKLTPYFDPEKTGAAFGAFDKEFKARVESLN